MVRNKDLAVKYQKIVESKTAVPIKERDKALFERLIDNQFKYLKEQTLSGDLAILGQILVPVFRRAFPQLFGKDIVGVQPMSQAVGYAFALRYHYVGNTTGNSTNRVIGGASSHLTTDYHISTPAPDRNTANSLILIWGSTSARQEDATDTGYGAVPTAGIGDLTGLCTVIFTLENKAVVRAVSSAAMTTLKALKDSSGSGVIEYYDNETGYLNVLKTYPGPLSTLVGEGTGYDMDELGVTIDKIAIEAKTRKLKARYTIESAQDLKAAHGKDMASELIDILTYEIAQSIDREIIDTINSQAVATTLDVSTQVDGRWQLEKFRAMYTELTRKSNDIARTTMRGPGNFIIGAPDVITALEQIPTFTGIAPIAGDVDSSIPMSQAGQALVGTIGGRFTVYRDVFAATDYGTVGYKGPGTYDAGVIYSPYIPLEMKETVEPSNAQPAIIFMERSAISANIFAGDRYYRKITFSNIFSKSS